MRTVSFLPAVTAADSSSSHKMSIFETGNCLVHHLKLTMPAQSRSGGILARTHSYPRALELSLPAHTCCNLYSSHRMQARARLWPATMPIAQGAHPHMDIESGVPAALFCWPY